MPINKLALAQKIDRSNVWRIIRKFEKDGYDGLKDHRPGRLFEPLNPKFYDLVVEEWKKNKCGARKLHAIMKSEGFSVSLRKISQVLVKEGLQKPNLKKRKPRRYKRYEWPLPNYMWHTDWHVIKSEKLKGENIIVYLDDCSRKVMGYAVGAMTTKNSIFALYGAIAKNLVTPFILNSDRGTQFFANKKDKEGEAVHEFQQELEELGILFVPSRRRHPQTNGKMEKFFHVLDSEFDERFETLEQFIDWYNYERRSEALDYIAPNEAYKKRL
jgi:transposase InsO family protein